MSYYTHKVFRATVILPLLACGMSISSHQSTASETVDPEPIKLGMSAALSGPAQDLGIQMRLGMLAAIQERNQQGGVDGRPIKLIALDDGYEPTLTAPNMHTLIQQEQVLAVVGNVGTPTAVTAIPIANENQTPFYGAYSGAGVLRKTPPDRYVINYRASYGQETAAMVDALIEEAGIKPEEIAFFTQRDSYGDAGFEGGMEALRSHGLAEDHAVAHGRYPRNTITVENALADIMQAQVECKAVIMVGAYAPCAQFITLAREVGMNPIFLNVSFVGANPLAAALEEVDAHVIVTQVVPPLSSDIGLVQRYRSALKEINPDAELSYGSLEGYLAMLLFQKALDQIDGDINRETVIDAFEGLGSFELDGGLEMSLSATDHQASDQVWATTVKNGRVLPMEWSELTDWLEVAVEGNSDD